MEKLCPAGAWKTHVPFSGRPRRQRRAPRGAFRTLSFLWVLGTVVPRPGTGQDFAEARMREGVDAYQSGRHADAVNALRVAAFGYLDRPPQLCRALVYLAIAQDAAGRRADALATANRLRDVQRRAATCAEAALDERVRGEFESRLGRPPGEQPAATAGTVAPPVRDPVPAATPVSVPGATAVPVPSRVALDDASPSDAVPAGDLDSPPKVRTRVATIYPRAAREVNIAGTVVLRVLVSETGRAERIETVKGIRPLADAAVASVRRWTFEPARRGGRNVPAWLVIEIPFQR
ncbi:MAG: TonB family protein [Acidobacteria bacterium]|nr:TonB family protein [Acidobacteriota bacterium]